MNTVNWDDASSRAAFIERVGPAAYNRALDKHFKDITIDVVNGYAIRPVQTRFGRLYAVGETGEAFSTMSLARNHAWSIKAG